MKARLIRACSANQKLEVNPEAVFWTCKAFSDSMESGRRSTLLNCRIFYAEVVPTSAENALSRVRQSGAILSLLTVLRDQIEFVFLGELVPLCGQMQKRGTVSSVSLSGGENPTLVRLIAKYVAVVHLPNPDVPAMYTRKLPFGNCQVAAWFSKRVAKSIAASISGVLPSKRRL